MYQSGDYSDFMLVFEDLSVLYVSNQRKLWTREEALSQVTQVEIFDKASLGNSKRDDLSYVYLMSEPVSWSEVPLRIIQRYTENA